jgi:protein-S-isoprenylcysteine O-methyltransferase Ste14
MMLLPHLLAILLLPFMVVVVVPYLLLTAFPAGDIVDIADVATSWGDDLPLEGLARLPGVVLFTVGLGLFCWCVTLFAKVGRGTLAPWDPTQALVAAGPYRHVRNPMISGVVTMLFGQALVWGSWAIALWAGLVLLINHGYFVLIEEPGLEARFGASYINYKARVPRWIPRW